MHNLKRKEAAQATCYITRNNESIIERGTAKEDIGILGQNERKSEKREKQV